MAVLTISMSGKDVERRTLENSLVIGRGDECQVRVNDTKLSRRHCRLEPCMQGWLLVDLDSTNGTLLDGKRVKRHVLADGQLFRAGGVTMRFEANGPAPRTLDDDVLDMLNEASPDATPEDPAAASWHNLACGDAATVTAAPPQEGASSVAVAPAGLASSAGPAPAIRQMKASLWDLAATAHPAAGPVRRPSAKAAGAMTMARHGPWDSLKDRLAGLLHFGNRGPNDGPWYRRRIPLPVAVALAVLFAACLYAAINYGNSPRVSKKPLVHHHATRWTD